MKKKKIITNNKINFNPLPPHPKNFTAAEYRYIASVLEELRDAFRPVLESSKKLRKVAENIEKNRIRWKKEQERFDEIMSPPTLRKKYLEQYKLHGKVSIFDFPLDEKESAT